MKNAQVQSFIDKIRDDLAIPEFRVDGWVFYLDSPGYFNPHTKECAAACGFELPEGAPDVSGFYYSDGNYDNYLADLIARGEEHPLNTEGLPWVEDLSNEPLPTIDEMSII